MPKKRFFVCPLNLKARDQMREHKQVTPALLIFMQNARSNSFDQRILWQVIFGNEN